MKFLKKFRPGADMTTGVELDADLVEASSGLETYRNWALDHVDLAIKAAQDPDPVQRMLFLTKYVLSTIVLTPGLKKPLNPILGELCLGKVQHDDKSETVCLSEQVSHHPPISASVLRNKKHGLMFNPNVTKGKATFAGTHVHIMVQGERKLTLEKFGEEYEITPPDLYIRIFRAAVEYYGHASIVCAKSGITAKMKYRAKPLIGGKWHAVEGSIIDTKTNETLHEFSGHWDSLVQFTDLKTKKVEDFDLSKRKPHTIQTPKLLDDRSSEMIWKDFKEAVRQGDMSAAQKAKHLIEEEQRARKKEGKNFEPRFFKTNENGDWRFTHTYPTFDGQPLDV